MDSEIRIRMASPEEAGALLEIYRPYVAKTAISFEYQVPSPEEFRNRIGHILDRYPWLVLERDQEIAGYAYAAPFKERAAYDWAVETTIYIGWEHRGRGYGRMIYQKLEEILARQNILNLNACIACTRLDDPYLTNASMESHRHMGYRLVGEFRQCGYKFGRWYDMVWMEKLLGTHPEQPRPVIPVSELAGSGIVAGF